MFFSVFPKSIETLKICDVITENVSLITPSIIEKEYGENKYIISFDSIIRECLVFDEENNLIDYFATIFTDLKYKEKSFKDYMK